MAAYYFSRFVSWLLCLLPASFCEALGNALGKATWCLVPSRRRRMAIENVMRCLAVSETEATRIAKASWARFGPMLMEVMRFPVLQKQLDTLVDIEGAEYLRDGLALGRGAVIATSHSGNWELMGGALSSMGFPIVGVAMRQKEAGFDRFINEYRRAIGMHITYKDNVREMFNMLKKGWTIGLLMDQDIGIRDGVIFEWFGGQPTNFVQGPATLARFQNAPLYPGYIHRMEDGRHKIILHPPIFVERTKDKAADIKKAMMEVSEVLEAHIRKYPEEWFWLHDRWKSVRTTAQEQLVKARGDDVARKGNA